MEFLLNILFFNWKKKKDHKGQRVDSKEISKHYKTVFKKFPNAK